MRNYSSYVYTHTHTHARQNRRVTLFSGAYVCFRYFFFFFFSSFDRGFYAYTGIVVVRIIMSCTTGGRRRKSIRVTTPTRVWDAKIIVEHKTRTCRINAAGRSAERIEKNMCIETISGKTKYAPRTQQKKHCKRTSGNVRYHQLPSNAIASPGE